MKSPVGGKVSDGVEEGKMTGDGAEVEGGCFEKGAAVLVHH